jgi:hypothetical protein
MSSNYLHHRKYQHWTSDDLKTESFRLRRHIAKEQDTQKLKELLDELKMVNEERDLRDGKWNRG